MSNGDLQAAVDLLVTRAPPGWRQLRARYYFYDGAMKIKTYYRPSLDSAEWKHFNFGGFELMDVFDAYRTRTHSTLKKPWSTVTLTVEENRESNVEFGYGDPSVLTV